MASILKPLDEKVVHKICSGQIIISLAVAIKELVENSLDAGAKSVEIRLKDYGSTMITVNDDGHGVNKSNFQALALKHYTSKISEFSDIYQCDSYGFRGEALSALCAIADVSIITRDSQADCGTFLRFNETGQVLEEKPHARTVGTTVFVKNIFSRLPVRRNIFLGRLKQEFAKALDLIKAYCMVSKGVRILCTNQMGDKNSNTLVSSFGVSVKENIVSAFGQDQIKNLLELHRHLPDEQVLEEFRITDEEKDKCNLVQFEGFISSCAHGEGRPARDRQFLYVNSRPCEYERITKLINAVYHQFQKNRYPFFFLDMKLPHGSVDINCSPDKRQIFLQNEKLILATIKASLLKLFRKVESSKCVESQSLLSINNLSPGEKTVKILNASLDKSKSMFEMFKSPKTPLNFNKTDRKSWNSPKESTLKRFFDVSSEKDIGEPSSSKRWCDNVVTEETANSISNSLLSNDILDLPTDKKIEFTNNECTNSENFLISNCTEPTIKKKVCENRRFYNSERDHTILEVNFEEIFQCRGIKEKQEEGTDVQNVQEAALRKFQATMNPEHNEQAEEELRRQLTKDMFQKMKIIGQWNLGFIIVQMGSDIFVVDQHAADEIYNFETLMKTTVLQNQRLVIPQQLQLPVSSEMTVIDFIDIFKKNGFDFKIDHSAEPTKRVMLAAIPISKGWTFGKDDVEELIAYLQDCPDVMCRPKRVRAMFASRACRKSIMIGDSLNMSDMRRVVDHLGELDEPWHCPHGRPTMRHLFNLKNVKEHGEDVNKIMKF